MSLAWMAPSSTSTLTRRRPCSRKFTFARDLPHPYNCICLAGSGSRSTLRNWKVVLARAAANPNSNGRVAAYRFPLERQRLLFAIKGDYVEYSAAAKLADLTKGQAFSCQLSTSVLQQRVSWPVDACYCLMVRSCCRSTHPSPARAVSAVRSRGCWILFRCSHI
jgi:hypothetical protein